MLYHMILQFNYHSITLTLPIPGAHQILENSSLSSIGQIHRIHEGTEGACWSLACCYPARAVDSASNRRRVRSIVILPFPTLRASRRATVRAIYGNLSLAVVTPQLSNLERLNTLNDFTDHRWRNRGDVEQSGMCCDTV